MWGLSGGFWDWLPQALYRLQGLQGHYLSMVQNLGTVPVDVSGEPQPAVSEVDIRKPTFWVGR
jgi:hypothetical protein